MMRLSNQFFLFCLLSILLESVSSAAEQPPPEAANASKESPRRLAVAAYFYPAGENLSYWDQLRRGHPQVAIAVATGLGLDGENPDANYQEQISKTREAGIRVLAYVTSSGSSRPLEMLKRDIDHAYVWYNVDGIFFDESVPYPVTCDQVEYHAELNDYVKTKGGPAITVLNHGQILPECYVEVADIQMNAETSYESYVKDWRPWGWEERYPAKKFWHMVHGVDGEEKLREVLALSKSRNAGYIFITSKSITSPAGPYGSLPEEPYWKTLLEQIAAPAEE